MRIIEPLTFPFAILASPFHPLQKGRKERKKKGRKEGRMEGRWGEGRRGEKERKRKKERRLPVYQSELPEGRRECGQSLEMFRG